MADTLLENSWVGENAETFWEDMKKSDPELFSTMAEEFLELVKEFSPKIKES